MRVKKAAGFPILYQTPPALAWQGFQPLYSAIYRTEHMARTAENPKNRRGFPFYSSGASNPKGSGAQYCSPPNTVIGIETADHSIHYEVFSNCSPPNTVIGIETSRYVRYVSSSSEIVALQIPSSVLKQYVRNQVGLEMYDCSPPNTVIGIKTLLPSAADVVPRQIVALQIPSSVFSSSSF